MRFKSREPLTSAPPQRLRPPSTSPAVTVAASSYRGSIPIAPATSAASSYRGSIPIAPSASLGGDTHKGIGSIGVPIAGGSSRYSSIPIAPSTSAASSYSGSIPIAPSTSLGGATSEIMPRRDLGSAQISKQFITDDMPGRRASGGTKVGLAATAPAGSTAGGGAGAGQVAKGRMERLGDWAKGAKDWGPETDVVKFAAGMGLAGGAASYITGGEFGQGALMGVAGGATIGRGVGFLGSKINQSMISSGMKKHIQKAGFVGNAASMLERAAPAIGNSDRRIAMLGGAGLVGMMGGGHRDNNKRRGFNAHRGNAF